MLKRAWGYQGNNLALPVENLESALPFYERIMGFRLVSRNDEPPRSAVLERDAVQIGLTESGGDPTQDGCAFEVDSTESAFAEFRANGLENQKPKFNTEQHGGVSWKVFYVVAPDGLCYWFGERQRQ